MAPTPMTRYVTGPDRARFRFPEKVRASFGFLETDYGFSAESVDESHASWTSQRVTVTVVHGSGSYELDVLIRPTPRTPAGLLRALRGDGGTPFGLRDVASWRQAADILRQMPLIVEEPDDMHDALDRLAGWTRTLADPLLRGDFRQLRALDRAVTKNDREATKRFGRGE